MNWDAIGAIGEIVGAIAVVVTLLYLAKQTRSNARALDATSSREFAYRLSEWDREAARDPEIRRVLMKSTSSELEEYSDEEWVAFRFLAISFFRIYETGYLHTYSEVGNLEESANHLISVRSLIDAWPAWKRLWENET